MRAPCGPRAAGCLVGVAAAKMVMWLYGSQVGHAAQGLLFTMSGVQYNPVEGMIEFGRATVC